MIRSKGVYNYGIPSRSAPHSHKAKTPTNVLIAGGDTAGVFQRHAEGHGSVFVHHVSGRKRRDQTRSIPQRMDAVVIVLDQISHALARKIRTDATRRGLPVFFRKRGRQIPATYSHASDLMQWLDNRE